LNSQESETRNLRAAAEKAAAFVSRWELIALAVLAPLFVFPPIGSRVLTLTLVLPCIWILEAGAGVVAIPHTPLNASLALLLLMVLISLGATFDVLFSAPKALGVVFGVAVFSALVKAVRSRGALTTALDVFAVAGAALAFISLLGTNWIGKMPLLRSVTAHLPAVIRGVPGQAEGFQPNAVAGALVMFIPLQLGLCFASAERRALRVGVFLVSASTLLLTQSRGGYLSLFAGVTAWLLWNSRRSRFWTIAGLLALILIAVPFRDRIASRLEQHVGSGVASDLPSRLELWSRALNMIEDFPITGAGINTFRRVMPVLYPASLTPPDVDVAHAHNHLLQAAVDLGLPGLIAYLALWFGAAALLVRAYRTRVDASGRWVIGGIAAGMIAYFVFGTADAIALGAKVGIFFWAALALIVSVHFLSEQAA
jgi:putative inorganic carbon (HCO3(-)) transporter